LEDRRVDQERGDPGLIAGAREDRRQRLEGDRIDADLRVRPVVGGIRPEGDHLADRAELFQPEGVAEDPMLDRLRAGVRRGQGVHGGRGEDRGQGCERDSLASDQLPEEEIGLPLELVVQLEPTERIDDQHDDPPHAIEKGGGQNRRIQSRMVVRDPERPQDRRGHVGDPPAVIARRDEAGRDRWRGEEVGGAGVVVGHGRVAPSCGGWDYLDSADSSKWGGPVGQ
jgi:hypothetical protein